MVMFLKTKDKVKFLSLAIIEANEYVYHGYELKSILSKNYDISNEVIYPTLREMQVKGLLTTKSILNKDSNKEQKKFKISAKGKTELNTFYQELEQFQTLLINIKNKKEVI